ncbi:hypothetical protein ACWIGI_35215 [Nocardia sp. NPDC055321]
MGGVAEIERCMGQVMEIPGALSVTLIDGSSGLLIAAAGNHPMVDDHENAAMATEVMRAVAANAALSAAEHGDLDELIVCRAGSYHLLVPVRADYPARLFVHAMFDDTVGNLAFSRFRVRTILAEFDGSVAPDE